MEKREKVINVLGRKVKEKELKAALKDVIKIRGIEGILVLDKKMTKKEELCSISDDEFQYANIYKYAFF